MAQYSVSGGDIACLVGLTSKIQCVLEPNNSKFLFQVELGTSKEAWQAEHLSSSPPSSSKLHWALSLYRSLINLLVPRLVTIAVCLLLMQLKVIVLFHLLPKPSNKTKARPLERATLPKGRYSQRKVGCYSPFPSSTFIHLLISHTVFT